MCPVPSSAEHGPITASVGVLLGTAVVRGQNSAERVYARGDSEVLVIATQSLGFIFVLGEVK